MCKKDLKEFGAVVISPPLSPHLYPHIVVKYHICKTCWEMNIKILINHENTYIPKT